MRDGQATRRRILAAATAEFSAYGIAGARVERIAATAAANKAQLYAYFGNKDKLFDLVWEEHLQVVLDMATLDGDDLPRYAGDLYDAWVERPELVRLGTWARLERTPAGHLLPESMREQGYQLDKIAAAQRNGSVRADLTPFEVQSMILSLSLTWSPASLTYTATADESREVHEHRRQTLIAAAERLFRP